MNQLNLKNSEVDFPVRVYLQYLDQINYLPSHITFHYTAFSLFLSNCLDENLKFRQEYDVHEYIALSFQFLSWKIKELKSPLSSKQESFHDDLMVMKI
jgi:hypothetical protein